MSEKIKHIKTAVIDEDSNSDKISIPYLKNFFIIIFGLFIAVIFYVFPFLNYLATKKYGYILGLFFGQDYFIHSKIALFSNNWMINDALKMSVWIHVFMMLINFVLFYKLGTFIIKSFHDHKNNENGQLSAVEYFCAVMISFIIMTIGSLIFSYIFTGKISFYEGILSNPFRMFGR